MTDLLKFFIAWCTLAGLAGAVLGYLGYRANRHQDSAPAAAERCGELCLSFFGDRWFECVLRPQHQGSHASEEGTRWFATPEESNR
ncbi:hypothetical protein ACFCYM_09815 [Streptomyces sp. NPDC056254]|uniref:hypothetical protein n=1 Tax=Streptomyces sp. NPDC056254 TaxID=3345763 RepID=UPI0035DDA38A